MSHPVSTPMDLNHRIHSGTIEDRIVEPSYYQSIIGSNIYAATGSRPDLAYTTTFLLQFNNCPTSEHLQAARRVLRYLQGTKDQVLLFSKSKSLYLEGYADASYANDLDTRRSVSGYVFSVSGSIISWRSKKQKSVATSTTEAEYMALSLASRQTMWLKRAFIDLRLPTKIAIYCDNTGAIEVANNPKINERTKHIDVAYHYTREKLEEHQFELFYVASDQNLADICIKALAKPAHDRLRGLLACRQ